MASTLSSHPVLKGGEFLITDAAFDQLFTPDDFSEEQLMVVEAAQEFIKARVVPNAGQIEGLDLELTVKLLEEAGELGLLGAAFPEEYGGTMQPFVTNMLLSEVFAEARSFGLSLGAHIGIGMLPILYFGNEEQKQHYLPRLIKGEWKAAYCLTEPESGSDALAAKSYATLNEAGTHYLLNGQKMWITNAGFADVFIVFAKVDKTQFTGFVVERAWVGVSLGEEEKKLGIKGSSTRQVFFENVEVPVGNVLGQIGKGHRIAFNILNIGRIKLAAAVIGGCKLICSETIRYANERHQFGKSIGSFGAIQHKIAEQAIRTFAVETALYRASMDIQHREQALLAEGKSLSEALLGAAEEYAIECALMKVHGSEVLDYVADEGLQVFGGMGYSEEAPMASVYRDARINRIFEGTNEINRMLSIDMLLKRAMAGKLDLMTPALAVQKELTGMPVFSVAVGNAATFHAEKEAITGMKKAVLMTLGATVQQLMMELEHEQEILINLSDMMAEVYLAESLLLRVEKRIAAQGEAANAIAVDVVRVFINDAMERLALNGRNAILAWAEGDMKRTLLLGLKRFTKYEGINTKAARRRIAASLLAENKYLV